MPHWRFMRSALCIAAILLSHGCATLPNVSMTTNCGTGWQPAVRIQAVDRHGQIIRYTEVIVLSDDPSTRYRTWTSSLGEARFALPPGSYSIGIGEYGKWQGARRSVKVHPDCQVDMHATLIPYEVFPLDGPVVRRTR